MLKMKPACAIALLLLILLPLPATADDLKGARIGEHVTIQTYGGPAHGFLMYVGVHGGVTFRALSGDIGSASPSEDFGLYASRGDKYEKLVSFPFQKYQGFKCVAEGSVMKVYLIKKYDDGEDPKNLILSIDLAQLAKIQLRE